MGELKEVEPQMWTHTWAADSRFGLTDKTYCKKAGPLTVTAEVFGEAIVISASCKGLFKTHRLEIVLEDGERGEDG